MPSGRRPGCPKWEPHRPAKGGGGKTPRAEWLQLDRREAQGDQHNVWGRWCARARCNPRAGVPSARRLGGGADVGRSAAGDRWGGRGPGVGVPMVCVCGPLCIGSRRACVRRRGNGQWDRHHCLLQVDCMGNAVVDASLLKTARRGREWAVGSSPGRRRGERRRSRGVSAATYSGASQVGPYRIKRGSKSAGRGCRKGGVPRRSRPGVDCAHRPPRRPARGPSNRCVHRGRRAVGPGSGRRGVGEAGRPGPGEELLMEAHPLVWGARRDVDAAADEDVAFEQAPPRRRRAAARLSGRARRRERGRGRGRGPGRGRRRVRARVCGGVQRRHCGAGPASVAAHDRHEVKVQDHAPRACVGGLGRPAGWFGAVGAGGEPSRRTAGGARVVLPGRSARQPGWRNSFHYAFRSTAAPETPSPGRFFFWREQGDRAVC